jgi:hypothetical protein
MKKLFLAALTLSLGISIAHAQPVPTLSLDFENGADGIGANGKAIAPRVEGKTEFAPGKFGQAFKSGPASGYLHFPAPGVLRPEEGTVEMWVSPLDWSGDEKRFHVFFDARGDGVLYLYKFLSSDFLMLTAADAAGPFHNAATSVEKWKAGQWHHIAGTWSETQQNLYIDGKLAASAEPSLPRRLDAEFMIGDNPWTADGGVRASSSLIDNVRIYDRALSPEHIAAHFNGDYQKAVPLTEKSLSVLSSLAAETRLLSVAIGSGGADVNAGSDVKLEILQNEKVLQTTQTRFVGSLAKTELSLEKFAPGDYQLRVSVAGAGAAPIQIVKPLVVREKPVLDTSWLGNKIGLDEKIPIPWTPLQVSRDGNNFSVACWGREYQFGAAPLPTQITSQNQPLLASPIALKIISGGKEISWKNASAKITAQSGYAVDIEGHAEAATVPGVLLTTKLHLEYDGVMVVNFALQTPENFQAENVSIEMPVRESNAIYRHHNTNAWEGFSGAVPAGNGVVEKTAWTPFGWLGGNERGLFWFCETGQFWPHHKSENAYETVRSPGAVTMRLNLIQGESLPQNWNYQFGIQATPVKSVPRDWRKERVQIELPMPGANVDILWPTAGRKDAHKYFGYPEAADDAAMKARVDKLHAAGFKVIPYTTLTQMWAETPEWLFFNRDWSLYRPTEKSLATGVNYTPRFEWLLATNKAYSDWMAWKHDQFMEKFGFDGYYLDQAHPYQTTREEAGGWKDEAGNWQPVYPILAYRDLYRRFYKMVKENNPNAFILLHMSGKMGIPYVAYSDAYIDGEHFRGKFKDPQNKFYTDILPLDAVRAEYMGRQWGVAPYFLPELWNEDATPEERADVEKPRGLMAMLMVHDITPVVLWSNPQPFKDAFNALDKFGFAEADFIPYFDANPPASTGMKDVYVSVYKRDDGRALAIVANLSKEVRSGIITLNAKRIGLPTSGVLLWPEKTPATQNGDKITLSLPKQSYQMLLIGKAP